MNRLLTQRLIVLCLALISFGADAASTNSAASGSIEKELQKQNFRVGRCNIATMNISFRVKESYGQLLVNGRMGWTSGANTSADCLADTTHIWVTLRTPQGDRRYLKLNPGKALAGAGLGPSGSTSPSWSTLFCHAANDSTRCEPEARTRELIGARLGYEGFTVVAATGSLANMANIARNTRGTGTQADRMALDSRLSSAIDNAFINGDSGTGATTRTGVVNNTKTAQLAVNNIITLLSSSLSQYAIPAHDCESKRTVSQWVQVNGECQVNFRSESQHNYLCEADQVSRPIRATSNVTINLGQDLAGPAIIKQSNEGWSALVLALNQDLTDHTEAKSHSDRWQITADTSKLDDLELVARQLDALKSFCENK
jgi:hypothetical protein